MSGDSLTLALGVLDGESVDLDDRVHITHPGLTTWFINFVQKNFVQCLPFHLRSPTYIPSHTQMLKRLESPPREPSDCSRNSGAIIPRVAEGPLVYNGSSTSLVDRAQPTRLGFLAAFPRSMMGLRSSKPGGGGVDQVVAAKQDELGRLNQRIAELERRRDAADASCREAEARAMKASTGQTAALAAAQQAQGGEGPEEERARSRRLEAELAELAEQFCRAEASLQAARAEAKTAGRDAEKKVRAELEAAVRGYQAQAKELEEERDRARQEGTRFLASLAEQQKVHEDELQSHEKLEGALRRDLSVTRNHTQSKVAKVEALLNKTLEQLQEVTRQLRSSESMVTKATAEQSDLKKMYKREMEDARDEIEELLWKLEAMDRARREEERRRERMEESLRAELNMTKDAATTTAGELTGMLERARGHSRRMAERLEEARRGHEGEKRQRAKVEELLREELKEQAAVMERRRRDAKLRIAIAVADASRFHARLSELGKSHAADASRRDQAEAALRLRLKALEALVDEGSGAVQREEQPIRAELQATVEDLAASRKEEVRCRAEAEQLRVELQEAVADKATLEAQLQKELAEVTEQLADAQQRSAELLDAKDAMLRSAEARMEDATRTLDVVEKKLTAHVQELEGKLVDRAQNEATLQQQIADVRAEVRQLMAELQGALREREEARARDSIKVKELKKRLRILEKNQTASVDGMAELRSRAEQEEERRVRQEEELLGREQQLQQRLQALTEELELTRTDADEAKLEALQTEDYLREKLDQRTDQMAEARAEFLELNETLASLQQRLRAIEREALHNQTEAAALQTRLERKEEEAALLQGTIEKMRSRLSADREQRGARALGLKEELKDMRGQLISATGIPEPELQALQIPRYASPPIAPHDSPGPGSAPSRAPAHARGPSPAVQEHSPTSELRDNAVNGTVREASPVRKGAEDAQAKIIHQAKALAGVFGKKLRDSEQARKEAKAAMVELRAREKEWKLAAVGNASQVRELKGHLRKLNETAEALLQREQSLQKLVTKLRGKLNATEDMLRVETAATEVLLANVSRLESLLARERELEKRLEGQGNGSATRLTAATEQTEQIRDLEAAISRLQFRVAADVDMSARARQLESQIQGLKSSMTTVEAVAVKEHEELLGLRQRLADEQRNSSQVEAERSKLQQQEAELRQRVGSLQQALESVEQDKKKEAAQVEAAARERERELEEARAALASAQDKVAESRQQIEALREQLARGEEEQAERARLEQREQALQGTLVALKESFRTEQLTLTTQREEAAARARALEADVELQRAELAAAHHELQVTRSNATLYQEQLELARHAMAEYVEEQDEKEHSLALELESVRMQLDAHWEDENLKSKQLETLAASLEETLAGANKALRESEVAREELVRRQTRMLEEGSRNASALEGLRRREQELQALLGHAEAELHAMLRWLQADSDALNERPGRTAWRIGVLLNEGQESKLGELLGSVEDAALGKVRAGEVRVAEAQRRVEALERESADLRAQEEQQRAAMAREKEESTAVQAELAARTTQLQLALAEADEALRKEREGATQREGEVQRTRAELEEKVRSSEQASREAGARLAAAEREAGDRTRELQLVRAQLQSVEEELRRAREGMEAREALQRREEELQRSLGEVLANLTWHRERLASVEQEHAAELYQLSKELEISRYALLEAQTTVEQAQKNASAVLAELEWVRGALTEERARKLKSEEELVAKQRELEDQLESARAAASRGEGLGAAFKEEAERTSMAYKAELAQVRQKLQADRERMEGIERMLAAEQEQLEAKVAMAEAALAAEQARSAALEAEMSDTAGRLQGELAMARREAAELQEQMSSGGSQIQVWKQEADEVKQTLANERASHRSNVQDLLKEQRRLEEELTSSKMKVARLEDVDTNMRAEAARTAQAYQAELLKLQEQLRADHNQMAAVEQELIKRTEDLEKDLATALEQLQAETGHLQEAQAAKDAETAKLRAEIEKAQQELRASQAQMQAAHQTAQGHKQELDAVTTTLESERKRIKEAQGALQAKEQRVARELQEVQRQMQNATTQNARARHGEERLRDKVKREREELGKKEEELLVRERQLKEQVKAAMRRVETEAKRRQSAEQEAEQRRQALQDGLQAVQGQAARAEQRLAESEQREREQYQALQDLRERVRVAESRSQTAAAVEPAGADAALQGRLRAAETQQESARAREEAAEQRRSALEQRLAESEAKVAEARALLEETERSAAQYREEAEAMREELKREETEHVRELQELRSGLLSVQQQLMLRSSADSAPADQQSEARVRSLEAMLEGANKALRESEVARAELVRGQARMLEEGSRNASALEGLRRREQELQALLGHAEAELHAVLPDGGGGVQLRATGESEVPQLLSSVAQKLKESEAAVEEGKRRVAALEGEAAGLRRELEALREERRREEEEMLAELHNLASPEVVNAPIVPPLPSSESSTSPSPPRMRARIPRENGSDGDLSSLSQSPPRSPQVVRLRKAAEERERVMVSRQQELHAELDSVRRQLDDERRHSREVQEEGERQRAALQAKLRASDEKAKDAAEELQRSQTAASAHKQERAQLHDMEGMADDGSGGGAIDENARVALVKQLLKREKQLAAEIEELKVAREDADMRAVAAVDELALLKEEMEMALGDLEHMRAQ